MTRILSFGRTWAMVVGLAMINTAGADLDVPANVDFELVSPTEGYRFFIDLDPSSPDYYSGVKAIFDVAGIDRVGPWSVGDPQGYDHGYELLGFREPDFNGNIRGVYYWDCKDDGCNNGLAPAGQIVMPAPTYLNQSEICTRAILGHELFHHIQRAYRVDSAPNSLGDWVVEGQARAMQDKIYNIIDINPTGSCIAGYNEAVRFYLAGNSSNPPQNQLSIWNSSYRAALWWTYLMEQFGDNTDEPTYGADFVVQWYEQALLAGEQGDSFDITNSTIQFFDPTTDILETFQRFVLANVLKDMDLSANSDAFRKLYTYVDEQPNGTLDQDRYAEVVFADTLTVSNAQTTDSTTYLAAAYGSQYFDVDISQCQTEQAVAVTFDPSPIGPPEYAVMLSELGAWGVVVGQSPDGSGDIGTLRLAKLYKQVAEDLTIQFIQPADPYERAFVTTTGVVSPIFGDLTVSCFDVAQSLDPDLLAINDLNPITPGPGDQTVYGEICVTPGTPQPGMDPSDYGVAIDGDPVPILAASPRDSGHCLQVEIPATVSSTQDVTVTLGGQSTAITDAIVRNTPAPNVIFAVDTSSTMLLPPDEPLLEDARDLVREFARRLLPLTPGKGIPKIGLINFAGDDIEPNMDAEVVHNLDLADAPGLSAFDSAVDNLSSGPGRFTSIGDAIQVALDEFAARGDPDQRKHLVLITDGSENEGAYWADLKDSVQAVGYVLHVLALGPNADQPLAYEIARSTGGRFAYIPVSGTEADLEMLFDAMESVAAEITGQIAIAQQTIPLDDTPQDFAFVVPPKTISLLLPAVQTAREAEATNGATLGTLTLTAPDGQSAAYELTNVMISSYNISGSGQEPTLAEGVWTASFAPKTGVTGELNLRVVAQRSVPLVLEATFSQPNDSASGNNRTATIGVDETISVGSARSVGISFLDGCAARGDCAAGIPDQPVITGRLPNGQTSSFQPDVVQSGVPTAQASGPYYEIKLEKIFITAHGASTGLPDSGTNSEMGSYHFQAEVPVVYPDYVVTYLTSDSFAVNSDAALPDGDRDGLPDPYEARFRCLDPEVSDSSLDPDADGLVTIDEFTSGANPCDPDTDRGGEIDGSEVAGRRDPLLRSDDALPAVAYLRVDHEVTDADREPRLAPSSISLAFANHRAYDRLILKRGTPGNFEETFPIDAGTSNGVFTDTSVVPGTEYCYQMEAFDRRLNTARPSELVCETASLDPAQPWGAMVINWGAPRAQGTTLTLSVELYNKDPATSEMQIEVDGTSTGWIPYTSQYTASVGAAPDSRRVSAGVRFRHDGVESPVFTDSIELWPAGSLGAITGQALPDDEPPLAGVLIYLDRNTEAPGLTDSNGYFTLNDILPGSYQVTAAMLGRGSAVSGNVTVTAGQTLDIGPLNLAVSDVVFADGFEPSMPPP